MHRATNNQEEFILGTKNNAAPIFSAAARRFEFHIICCINKVGIREKNEEDTLYAPFLDIFACGEEEATWSSLKFNSYRFAENNRIVTKESINPSQKGFNTLKES